MKPLFKHNHILLLGVFLFLLLTPEVSFAKIILDNISSQFHTGTMKWQPTISGYAQSLFWKLALIDFTWTTIVWVKDRKEFGEIISGFVGKIFTLLFFYTVLRSATDWIPQVIDTFSVIGKEAATSAGADVGTLDSILFQGFNLAYAMFGALGEGWSLLHPLDAMERIATSIVLVPSAIIVALGFSLIAGQLLVTLLESYIVIYGGIILLGFGGSRWTSEMATAYFKFAVGTGVKLMLCYLIIGLGFNIITMQIDPALMKTDFIGFCLTIVILTVLYVYIVFSIPGLASGMLSGSPNMTLGGMAGAAITAGAGLAGAGAVAGAMGGKAAGMAGSAAAEAGGVGKALKAGFDQNRSSGMGFGESAMKAPVPGIKSAASMVGAKAVEAGKSLAEGGKGMLGKAGDAIYNSAGGKVASNIIGSNAGSAADSSGANSSAPVAGGGYPGGLAGDLAASENASGGSASSDGGSNNISQASSGGDSGTSTSPSSNAGGGQGMVGAKAVEAGKSLAEGGNGMFGKAGDAIIDSAGGKVASHINGGATSTAVASSGDNNSAPASAGTENSDIGSAASPTSSGGGDAGGSTASVDSAQKNASNVAVGSSDPHTKLFESMNANLEAMANGPEQARKLHQKISSLRDFVPQDGATVQTSGISIGHTKD
ncbi:MAG: P-type conjugative transfer protein TrbL [Gallionella sp.]|nr:P-type conjugative transfer protein TrbL [Gallionella sp.]MDD4947721.1 P-type conjugative transfer protein TrbL [Gallionella sp.]